MTESRSKSVRLRVHVEDDARIVERGERVRVWFLPFRDGWIRAKDHPDADLEWASSEAQDARCPPGVVWRRAIELSLPPGTHLLCRTTSPLVERMTPLDYLVRERRGVRRHVQEDWYRVTGNYRLSKSSVPSAFERAKQSYEEKRPR